MSRKLLLVFIIIVFAMLALSVIKSRKGLWRNDDGLHIRLLTLRSILVIFAIIVFLIFTVWR